MHAHLVRGHDGQFALARLAEVEQDGVDTGDEDEGVCRQLGGEQCCRAVLVDDRVNPSKRSVVVDHWNAAPAAGYHHESLVDEGHDCLALEDA